MIQTDAALPTFLCVSLSKHSRRVGYMCGSHAINSTGGTGGCAIRSVRRHQYIDDGAFCTDATDVYPPVDCRHEC